MQITLKLLDDTSLTGNNILAEFEHLPRQGEWLFLNNNYYTVKWVVYMPGQENWRPIVILTQPDDRTLSQHLTLESLGL